ncbi:MAG: DUF4252 domain-containing protein [Bacteroidales bacterium]|nr:DUF4252 domain-containing protein [Bacteroidales bacterium]
MKRIILIAVLLLTALTASAQSGKSIYQKYSDAENVSAVYISPAMFRLIGKIPDLEVGDNHVNLAPLIRSLSGLYIINSENARVNEKLSSEVSRFISNGRYELLMESKDGGEVVRMYTVGTEKVVNSFVMIAADGPEATFICLDGQMDRQELETVLVETVAD